MDLYLIESEEKAIELLNGWSKKDLLKLADNYDVYYNRNDSVERLKERIVSATTGARLRSEAIATMRLR